MTDARRPRFGEALGFGLKSLKRDPLPVLVFALLSGIVGGFAVAYYAAYLVEYIGIAFQADLLTDEDVLAQLNNVATMLWPYTLAYLVLALIHLMLKGMMLRVMMRGEVMGLANVRFWIDELRLFVVGAIGWTIFFVTYLLFASGLLVALMLADIPNTDPTLGTGIVFGTVIAYFLFAATIALGMAGAGPLSVAQSRFNIFGGFRVMKSFFFGLLSAHIVAYLVLALVALVLLIITGLLIGGDTQITCCSFSFGTNSAEFFFREQVMEPMLDLAEKYEFIPVYIWGAIFSAIYTPIYLFWWGIPAYYAKTWLAAKGSQVHA